MAELLVLVDTQDNEIGRCEKLETHEKALLHRAFSVFIFRRILKDNPDGTRSFHYQLLIQKRAAGKYHSGGLWANTCCSHPRSGEELAEAIPRRLKEETDIDVSALRDSELEEKGAFIYKADFDNGLTEHEFDHVFVGWLREQDSASGQDPALDDWPGRNPQEAEEMRFVDVDWLMEDVLINTSKYAAWFMPALLIATEGSDFGSLHREASDRILY